MILNFQASPEAHLKLDKDGNKILSMHLNMQDLNLERLAYFHLRTAKLHILRLKKDVDCEGFLQEISIKSEVTCKFLCESEIDLNAVYVMCNEPESWECTLYDEQVALQDFAEKKKKEQEMLKIEETA